MSSEPDRMRDDRPWMSRVADIIGSGDTRDQMSVEDDPEPVEDAKDDDFPEEDRPQENTSDRADVRLV